MGTVFNATSKSAEAPDIEAAIYDATFTGTKSRLVTGGQYGMGDVRNMDGSAFEGGTPVDGKQFNKLEWGFALLDDEGALLYDKGEPVELQKLTGHGFNTESKTTPAELKVLKALLTPAEYAAFEAGEGVDEDSLKGRKVQVEVFVKENGWPGIGNVIAARKAKQSKAA